jgi:hypothetical protein
MKPETSLGKLLRLRALRLAVALKRAETQRSYPVVGLDDEMPFGKYRGKLLRDVIDSDPEWVLWAMENISTFEIMDDADAELDAARDVRRPPRAWES